MADLCFTAPKELCKHFGIFGDKGKKLLAKYDRFCRGEIPSMFNEGKNEFPYDHATYKMEYGKYHQRKPAGRQCSKCREFYDFLGIVRAKRQYILDRFSRHR